MRINQDHTTSDIRKNSIIFTYCLNSSSLIKLLSIACWFVTFTWVYGNDTITIRTLSFNSNKDEAYPVILNHDSILFTTNSDGLESIYLGNDFNKTEKVKKIVGGNHNYSCVGASPNKKLFLIYSDETGNGDLVVAHTDAKKILVISDMLPFPVNTEEYAENSGWISNTGDTIIFSSNRPGGPGGFDFWRSIKNGDSWDEPVLYDKINSDEDEMGITVADSIIYFGSKGFGSVGGFDIFYLIRKDTSWEGPYPLKEINTQYNDLFFGKEGYFCSNRNGNYDIFKADTIYNKTIVSEPLVNIIPSKDTLKGLSNPNQINENIKSSQDSNKLSKAADTLYYNTQGKPPVKSKNETSNNNKGSGTSGLPEKQKHIEMSEYFYIQIIALSLCNIKTNYEIIEDVCFTNCRDFNYKLKKEYHNNLNKYLINRKFLKLDEAIRFMNEVKQTYEIDDIFVVGYRNNKRYAIFKDLKNIYYY
jgi:hypothetical protein